MSNETGKTLKEAPKVGDRVRLPADYKGGGIWYVELAGTSGRVTRADGSAARVEFDNGRIDNGDWRYLAPESTPAAPESLTHITINGTRYRLTPETEAPAEENKEPEVGEVWEVLGELVLVTEDYNVRLHNGRMGGYDHERIKDLGTFVAASLEEGIRGGFITADNLRYHAPRH